MLRLSLEIPMVMLPRWAPLVDVDFILAHKVLQDVKYAEFFAQRSMDREAILDNSTHEFGAPMPLEDLEEAAKRVCADFVVAPDVVHPDISDFQVERNLQWLQETAKHFRLKYERVAAVMCGHTFHQRTEYFEASRRLRVGMLCFSFHDMRRLDWFEELTMHRLFWQIPRVHVLGMHNVEELKKWVDLSERHEHIDFSFDTCKPLKFGVQRMRLDTVTDFRGGAVRAKEVLELTEFDAEQIECVEWNIQWLKKVCRGEA